MGLIEYVHDLDSPDVNDRFNAVSALWKLGMIAAPAVPKLASLLGDIDGVNVKTPDGREVMITVAERASLALSAIGETAAGAVIEELKKDNAVSAIHCVRALAAPALAKRAPVSVLGERLMRPKVSPAMAAALCDVLAAAMQSPDEAHRNAARSAMKAAQVMGRVPAKHQAVLAGTTTAAPAVRPAAAPPAPPVPAAAPRPAAPIPSPLDEAPAPVVAKPAPAAPPPAPAPVAAVPPPAPEPVVQRPVRPAPRPDPVPPPAVDRPSVAFVPPVTQHPPTAALQPEIALATPAAATPSRIDYAPDDRFQYRSQIGDMLKRGEKLQAVNLLRAKTGASLVEALKQIESWA